MNKHPMPSKLLATVFLIIVCILGAHAQIGHQPSKKQARRWTEQGEWANGLARPHKTTDYQEFYSQYHKNKELWDKMFRWMAENDLANMPAGSYPIDGKRCYVNVQDATTQDAAKRKIEAHRNGIDIQYVVKGTERFGIVPIEDAEPITDYKPDVCFYKSSKVKYVDSNPDVFFMFFPRNCHQALVKAGKEGEKIRVIVGKMEYVP